MPHDASVGCPLRRFVGLSRASFFHRLVRGARSQAETRPYLPSNLLVGRNGYVFARAFHPLEDQYASHCFGPSELHQSGRCSSSVQLFSNRLFEGNRRNAKRTHRFCCIATAENRSHQRHEPESMSLNPPTLTAEATWLAEPLPFGRMAAFVLRHLPPTQRFFEVTIVGRAAHFHLWLVWPAQDSYREPTLSTGDVSLPLVRHAHPAIAADLDKRTYVLPLLNSKV